MQAHNGVDGASVERGGGELIDHCSGQATGLVRLPTLDHRFNDPQRAKSRLFGHLELRECRPYLAQTIAAELELPLANEDGAGTTPGARELRREAEVREFRDRL